ncbi:MAG TPA: ABC transporter substrate-binding protein [Acidimicrobiales bacterium]|nr:ABC transporter substrate-binding protein [Acidimicrobiales bacterium]
MPSDSSRRTSLFLLALLTLVGLVTGACGGGGSSGDGGGTPAQDAAPVTVRLGYFPNVTHATAIVGVEKGIFQEKLGTDKLEVSTFNAGPAAVEALFSEALDATYVGPNPAINAFVKSRGEAIRIISGATSGGAALVVQPEIADAADLAGKKVASPQLGGTQDVALRSWLKDNGLKTTPEGGGDVSVVPQENSQTVETFKSRDIAGAWVPEPWATRLVSEGGGKVLVDEATLWPKGEFVTTHLVVRTKFLQKHPGAVARLLDGQVAANAFIAANVGEAQSLVNHGIEKVTSKRLADSVIAAAWKNLHFTNDPIAASLATSAKHAEDIGLLEKVDLDGIYDLGPLNAVLRKAGEKEVPNP